MTLALAAFAFAASAQQFVLGGNIGLSHDGKHDDNFSTGSEAYTNISIMPKFGYWLNDKMQIGAQLGWDYSYNRHYYGADDTYTSHPKSAVVIAPYFRYNVANWKKFTVFCEAQLNVTLGLESSSHEFDKGKEVAGYPDKQKDNFTSFGINVVPGLNYAFNSNFSMDLYINLARLYAEKTSYEDYSTHEWGLGANMNAQSINAHLSNFSIGFNYSF